MSNAPTFQDAIAMMERLGEEARKGATTLPRVLQETCALAAAGAIDTTTKVKIGDKEKRHSTIMYERYNACKASPHGDATKAAKASNINQTIALGNRHGDDACNFLNQVVYLHSKELAKHKSLKEANLETLFEGMNKCVRYALDRAGFPDDAGILTLLQRADAKEKTFVDRINDGLKNFEMAYKCATSDEQRRKVEEQIAVIQKELLGA